MDTNGNIQTTRPVITFFESDELNTLGADLIELYKQSKKHLKKAYEYRNSAVKRRWECGKRVAENHEKIINGVGSQRAFAEKLGITEAMLSNDKRAYLALKNEGADTFQEALKIMQKRNIKSITNNWEKLPRLLSEPQTKQQKDNRAKDEKRLQQIYDELEEIRQRNQNAGGDIPSKADEVKEWAEQLVKSLDQTDPRKYKWKSRYYLDWVKSLGMDFLTMNPADNLDPHHTDIKGGAGGSGMKLPDVFTIPVSRDTHNKVERGNMNPSQLEIADALIRTMALFIITHYPDD